MHIYISILNSFIYLKLVLQDHRNSMKNNEYLKWYNKFLIIFNNCISLLLDTYYTLQAESCVSTKRISLIMQKHIAPSLYCVYLICHDICWSNKANIIFLTCTHISLYCTKNQKIGWPRFIQFSKSFHN